MRTEHLEQIQRWAEYFKNNPIKARGELNKFIDSQIIMANDFYKRLAETEEGKQKIKEIRLK